MPLVDVSRINVGSQALPRFQLGQQQGLAQQQAQQLSAQQAQEQRLRGQLLGVQQAPVTPQQQLGAPIAQPPITAQQAAPVAPVAPVSTPPAPVQAAPEATRGLTDDQAIAQLFVANPALGETTLNQMGLIDQTKRNEAANFAFDIQDIDPDRQDIAIQQRAQQLQAQGRDPSDTLSLLQLDPIQRTQALKTVQIAALSPEARAKLATGGADAKRVLDQEKLRFSKAKDFRTEAERFEKPFRERAGAIANVRASASGALAGNTASAISLVFNFFKTIDPASTVREGEVTTAQEAGAGATTRLTNLYNGLVQGEVAMTPKQINNILNDAEGQFATAEKSRNKEKKRLVSTAKRFKVEEADIFGEELAPSAPPEGDDLTPEEEAEFEQLKARFGQ